ncbi:TonB-dependent receptor [Pseudoalteromonas piscicida]|uniref:TonB-dependent receptor n=1 Tax=Pseudoalteromonas piscicida TaxID=43662 RepID=UPI0030A110DD
MNNNTLRYNKSLITAAVSAAILGISTPTLAEEQSSNAKVEGLERIEVTARKTTESLQEVPVTLTSIGALELAEKGIEVITEIQQFSPNTTLQTSRATNSTLTAFIRGVGQQDPLWGYEPGVGIYIDDVYLARPQGAVLDLLDVERIEVLRGPQGTLYGKNTVGGAVKYVTKPMSGDTRVTAQATVGSYNQRDLKLTGQIPLVEDKLYLGFGYANLNRDGFGEFLSVPEGQDKENYNKDLTAARLTLEYRPRDDLFMRLAWDKTTDDSNSRGGVRLIDSDIAPRPDSIYDSYSSLPTWTKVELSGLSFTLNWDVNDNFSLKYVGSTRDGDSPINIDFDNTPAVGFDVPAFYDDEFSSHEIQATYSGDGYTVVGGVYDYDSTSCGRFDALLFGGAATFENDGCNNSESTAVYVQSSIDLSEKWSMTVGARYTSETKTALNHNGVVLSAEYPSTGWVPGYTRPETDSITGSVVPLVMGSDTNGDGILDAGKSADFSKFSPRLGVEYQYDADTMLFASYSQGFKSGMFNPRAAKNEEAVDPEVVDSFEIGVKKDWGNSLRTNVTLFDLDHKDRQYIVVLPATEDAPLDQRLANAASSSIKGIEAELSYVATDNLTLDLALGWLDSSIEQDPNIGTPLVGISNTPDYTLNLAASYVMQSSVGDFVFNANYYYRDDYLLFEEDDDLQQDGYGMVNLSVAWESPEGNWFASLHAKNLTDEEYLTGGYDFVNYNEATGSYESNIPNLTGDTILAGYYGDPTTYHLTVGYRF